MPILPPYSTYQDFIRGQILGGGGGGNLHIYLYVHVYTHTRSAARHGTCVFNDIKKPTQCMHAACISGFLSEYNDKDGAMAKYCDVMRGRYVCEMIVV